jgi:hypothetical protein
MLESIQAYAAAPATEGSKGRIAGALATRWAVYRAGFASAADPRYVVDSGRQIA